MGNNRSKVPDLEKLVKGGRKKFVRYEEGQCFIPWESIHFNS